MSAKKQSLESNSPTNLQYPRFISNTPKGIDLFEGKSQDRLAKAIAAHITETDANNAPVFSRLIGLEGKWGSGKSNVIKILEENLEGSYTLFPFDAWGNQEDLQRRSILELLTKHLITKGKLSGKTKMRVMKPEGEGKVDEIDCTWDEKLESLLSRKSYTRDITVPAVNNSTKWFVLALLAMGLVIAYLAVNKTNIWWIDILIALSPLIVFTLGMLFTGSSWPKMFAMYNTEGRSDTTSYVISEQEPSVREFKEWMEGISKSLPKDGKLVVVFDNMDRLPSDKVRQFWSLIQTFFADDGYPNIWCIIPYDERHLAEFFDGNEEEKTVLLKGFLGKTFPVVYRVPEPIVTDYKNIFDKLYRDAFGATVGDEDIETISRCYRHIHPEPNVRDIIAFVNNNVLLTKQWGEAISPIGKAVYTLKSEEMLRNPFATAYDKGVAEKKKATTDEYILSNEFFSDFRKILSGNVDLNSMRSEISALVYGIDPGNADQIVVRRYIRNALSGKVKDAKLNRYVDNPHFMVLLSEDVHSMEVTDYANAASLIDKIVADSLSDADKNRLTGIWRFFARQYTNSNTSIKEFTDYEHIVFGHARPDLAQKCANSFCQRLIGNKEVDGKQLFSQLAKLFDDDFAETLDPQTVCPTSIIEAKRFADYVLEAGNDYKRFPVKSDASQLNQIIEKSVDKESPYLGVLRLLKDDSDYSVAEVGGFAVQQLAQKKDGALTANNLIAIQRVFYDSFQNDIDANYITTLWQDARSEAGRPAYDEIYALKSVGVYEQLPEDERHVEILMQKVLFYTSTQKIFTDYLANTSIHFRRNLLKKMVVERKHDSAPDYPEFIGHWQDLVNNLGVERKDLVKFADDWGYKHISDQEKGKKYFTLINDVGWIDTLLEEESPLSQELLNKCAAELIQQPINQFVQANTFSHPNTPWNTALGKLIDTNYINSQNLGSLTELAVYLLDHVAQQGAFNDKVWSKLLDKVEYASISSKINDIRNNILNGVQGYTMTPDKFKRLHTWLESSGINADNHCADSANQILSKVIDNQDCQAIILERGEYYAPIVSNTIETASSLHTKLKKIVAEQPESDFAKFVMGVVAY